MKEGSYSKPLIRHVKCCVIICLIWFFTSRQQSFNELCSDGSSWIEPVLSYDYMSCSRTQRTDAFEARNRGPLVSSKALYHWATSLLKCSVALNTPITEARLFDRATPSFCFNAQIICNHAPLLCTSHLQLWLPDLHVWTVTFRVLQ